MDDQILDPNARQSFPENFNRPQTDWTTWLMNNKLALLGGFLLLVLLIVASLWFFRGNGTDAPNQANVLLDIKGPEKLASGNETELRFVYTNGENADLVNVTLEVFFPSNFKFSSSEPPATSSNGQRYNLPVVRQGQSAEVKIKGKLSGATGENKEFRAKLDFTLSNFNSGFFVEDNHRIALTAPELELEITGPIDVTNGQNSTFFVSYKNVSGKEFDAAAIELYYPEGFVYVSALPSPSKNNNFWSLGKLTAGASGKLEVTGSFIGDPGSEQQVEGDLGLVLNNALAPQIHASARFKIQASSLSVTQEASPADVVNLGQSLQFTLKYANFGSTGQSNVVISTTLEGASIDTAKIKSSDGIVTGNTITWKSATVPKLSLLSPNQQGSLNFTVPIKPTISTFVKNQTVKSSTQIYSDQVTTPVRGQVKEVKLGTEIVMIVSGNYVSGALPMQVGQTTTFNINILLTNLSNDVNDTVVVASMPLPASAWANVVVPDSEKANVTFDQNASKIRWRVGKLDAFVGKFTQARTLNFQLKVTPSESDRGDTMTLLRDILTTGVDSFTQKEIKSTELNQFTVSNLNDDQIDSVGSGVE